MKYRVPSDSELDRRRVAAEAGELDEDALTWLANAFAVAGRGPFALLRGLEERFPDSMSVRLAQLRYLLDTHGAGVPAELTEIVCSRLPFHPLARAFRAAALMQGSCADEVRGERMLRDAIRMAPDLVHPRALLTEALIARGRAEEALTLFDLRDPRFPVIARVVLALLALDRLDDAREVIEVYNHRSVGAGRSTGLTLKTRHEIALALGNLTASVEVCEVMGPLLGEDPDNARLEPWESELFLCLLKKADDAAAKAWANRVAVSASDLGRLAHLAVPIGRLDLARFLAERALELDPDESSAGLARALLLDISGDPAAAVAYWTENTGFISSSHLSSHALGRGDVRAALLHAEDAYVAAPLAIEPAIARAQARYAVGQLDGASEDARRAWQGSRAWMRADPVWEIRATRALVDGDRKEAGLLFHQRVMATATSDNDRARILRLLNAAGGVSSETAPVDAEQSSEAAEELPAHESSFVQDFIELDADDMALVARVRGR